MTPFTKLSKLSVGSTMEMRPQKPNQAEKYLDTMLQCGNDKAATATEATTTWMSAPASLRVNLLQSPPL